VPGRQRRDLAQVGHAATSEQVRQRGEVLLQAGRRHELQQPGWAVTRVPERVRDLARLPDRLAGRDADEPVAHDHRELTVEQHRQFVIRVTDREANDLLVALVEAAMSHILTDRDAARDPEYLESVLERDGGHER
jgi:hypothetical protein